VTRESSHILLSAIILTVLAAGVAVAVSQSGCDCNGTKTIPAEDKLVNSAEIFKGFEEGNEKVKVIINLTEPEQLLKTVNWRSKSSLENLHSEIKSRQQRTLATLGPNEYRLRHKFENQAGFSAEVTLDCLSKLMDDANVVSIEPVYLLQKHLAQGIPLINGMVYRSTYNGQGVAIAICDTGVDYTHPMLGGGGFPNSKVIGGYDFGDNDSNPFPTEAHGTCCAGIAAGSLGTVGDYIGGVAYNAKIYALKVEDSAGDIYDDSIIAAWNWCITHKNDNSAYPILVISNSLGAGRYYSACDSSETAFATAANNTVAAGITILASSGNDGYCDSIAAPACLSNIISVGAVYDAAFGTIYPCINSASCAAKQSTTDCTTGYYATDISAADKVTSYSNTASFLNLLAPSNQAYTADIAGSSGYSTGDYYSEFGGTSAACPYAAGAVACLQSAAKEITGNYLSPVQVKNILTSTGTLVTDGKTAITKPRANLASAIETLEPNSNPCTDITIGTGTSGWSYPMHTAYHDSRTQVIYLASEIGTGGLITNLAINVTTIPGQIMNNWTIRMKHTTLSAYSSYSFDSTGWTTVYQANESQGSTGWRTFSFPAPFLYNGTDNLLVDFSHNNSSKTSNGLCAYSTPGNYRSVYAYSNSTNGDPLSWTGTTSPTTHGSTNVPNIQMTICLPPPNAPVLYAEPAFTSGLCNTIFWDVVSDANKYYAQRSSVSNFSTIDSNSNWIADTNFQFCGLVSGQTYYYRVKARSQYFVESGWSNVVSSRQCNIPGDFQPDCDVDFSDLMIMANQWLQSSGTLSADINQDGIVNFIDFAELANHWLENLQ
jgi:subtilisin family serine protease